MEQVSGASADVWLPVRGYESLYEVSERGQVRSLSTGKVLAGWQEPDGYRRVNLYAGDGRPLKKRVHRLVCEAFHGPQPEGCEVGHLDGQRAHNEATNLKWVTRSENVRHSIEHGTFVGDVAAAVAASRQADRRADRNPNAKLSCQEVAAIRASSEAHRALARRYGVSEPTIRKARKGETWL